MPSHRNLGQEEYMSEYNMCQDCLKNVSTGGAIDFTVCIHLFTQSQELYFKHKAELESVSALAEERGKALQYLYDETMDYIQINNLGAHNNQSMVMARKALSLTPLEALASALKSARIEAVKEIGDTLKKWVIANQPKNPLMVNRIDNALSDFELKEQG